MVLLFTVVVVHVVVLIVYYCLVEKNKNKNINIPTEGGRYVVTVVVEKTTFQGRKRRESFLRGSKMTSSRVET